MSDLIGRRVEYNTGKRDKRDHFIWDVGRVRAIVHVNTASWEFLIEEHNGQLITSRHDEVCLIGEKRTRDLERNRRARQRRKATR